jgi:hypothetical protein
VSNKPADALTVAYYAEREIADLRERNALHAEIERLRVWLTAIGNLADVDADERGWMVDHALSGKPAPNG